MFIDQQVRQQIIEIEQKFIDATSIVFRRGVHVETAPTWRKVVSRGLSLLGLSLLPFCLDLSETRFDLKTTFFMLGLAAFFVTAFILLEHASLLTWVLSFIGAPVLVVGANIQFNNVVIAAFFLIQLGLLFSPMTRFERSALHLLLLWEFFLSAVAFSVTQQFFFVLTMLLAVVSGFRVYGVHKALRGLVILGTLVGLYLLFTDVVMAQIVLILLSPVIFFRIFEWSQH